MGLLGVLGRILGVDKRGLVTYPAGMAKTALSQQQEEVRRLYKARIPVRQIANLMGVSTQRVYQHLERLRELKVIR